MVLHLLGLQPDGTGPQMGSLWEECFQDKFRAQSWGSRFETRMDDSVSLALGPLSAAPQCPGQCPASCQRCCEAPLPSVGASEHLVSHLTSPFPHPLHLLHSAKPLVPKKGTVFYRLLPIHHLILKVILGHGRHVQMRRAGGGGAGAPPLRMFGIDKEELVSDNDVTARSPRREDWG